MANNPGNFSGIGNFLYGLLHPGQLNPAQLGWMVFIALAILNTLVLNLPLDTQVEFYRWIYSPILAVAFYAAKKPYPGTPADNTPPASLPPPTIRENTPADRESTPPIDTV